MAEVLKEFPPETRTTKYPWNDWCDGRIWKLEAGKDFVPKVESMRQAASKQCVTRGLELKSQKHQEGNKTFLILQCTKNGRKK